MVKGKTKRLTVGRNTRVTLLVLDRTKKKKVLTDRMTLKTAQNFITTVKTIPTFKRYFDVAIVNDKNS